ncbi:hypothetical protein LX32DRAFT_454035 [Colletotrichum zoysiae]|uniref:Uncharacterized protein n=1 Tax=Colletotrichum zoysiae TaxID=1216348 RepID=A0AAD9LZY3_9PEZI|nr:hypothetical protein LX32DRAFT_454035 [Colletotrichum zoysiae]
MYSDPSPPPKQTNPRNISDHTRLSSVAFPSTPLLTVPPAPPLPPLLLFLPSSLSFSPFLTLTWLLIYQCLTCAHTLLWGGSHHGTSAVAIWSSRLSPTDGFRHVGFILQRGKCLADPRRINELLLPLSVFRADFGRVRLQYD